MNAFISLVSSVCTHTYIHAAHSCSIYSQTPYRLAGFEVLTGVRLRTCGVRNMTLSPWMSSLDVSTACLTDSSFLINCFLKINALGFLETPKTTPSQTQNHVPILFLHFYQLKTNKHLKASVSREGLRN
jgi:hypothetical protein